MLIRDERALDAGELSAAPHGRVLTLEEMLPILESPDRRVPLRLDQSGGLTDGVHAYPVTHGCPVLYPSVLANALDSRGRLPLTDHQDPTLQYFALSQIKHSAATNAPAEDVHYQRHLYRMSQLTQACSGRVLDVGCGDVELGASLFPPGTTYVGLDPFGGDGGARVLGLGEILPFADTSFDCVLFNTSLDHMLDHHSAIEEAFRVLRDGGRLVICTLVWLTRATLLTDTVHFHHLREYEVMGALGDVAVEQMHRYSYKDASHRYSLYLVARKDSKAHA